MKTITISSGSEHPGGHCAWCGDPPDRYGSHTICTVHAASVYAELAALRQARQQQATTPVPAPASSQSQGAIAQ
ncbi:MAG: hypothetical protein M3Y81_18105 [Chloroflexota bacterium]|nr:hypothetical protein [Chloroflexota bacterium]